MTIIFTPHLKKIRFARAFLLSVVLVAPIAITGCGGRENATAPSNNGAAYTAQPKTTTVKKAGLNNAQKVGITLAGAAALYYIYNQHKKAKAEAGAESQYYLSKNGRVYYRDAQHKVHWVSPPSGGVQVSAEEAQRYKQYQGYNNQSTGRDLSNLPEAQAVAN